MKVKVTLIQDSPVFFDKEATLQKVEHLTKEHASMGSGLIVFPGSFVPGYPRGFMFGTKVGSRTEKGRDLYAKYYEHSFDISTTLGTGLESDDLPRMEQLAKDQPEMKKES